MVRVPNLLRTMRGRRLAAVAAGVAAMAGTLLVWSTVEHSHSMLQEVRWLRGRLAEKRELIARQRDEMAAVAGEIDRLARTASTTRERAAQVRLLAHMEETPVAMHETSVAPPTLDGEQALVSEDAARALEQLAWLQAQTAAAGDSFALLTALVKERTTEIAGGPPSLWPVHGLVTSPYGVREDPYGEGREMHPGIDIQARYGTPIAASAGGEVIFAGHDPGYGSLVVLDHGQDLQTMYGHLSAIYVQEGQHLRRGQVLGALGASGRATGAHLHYEVRLRGTPVDPARYLGAVQAARTDGWRTELVSTGSRASGR